MYLFPLLVGVDVMQLSHPRECRTCSTQFADILLEVFCDSLIPRHNDTRLLVLSTHLVLQVTTATGGQSLPEFFHTMRRQFTSAEWQFITAPPTEKQQLAMFYRFWVSVLSGAVLVCVYVIGVYVYMFVVCMYVCSECASTVLVMLHSV